MSSKFSSVPTIQIQRSSWSTKHSATLTLPAGYIVPVRWVEMLPGDTYHLELSQVTRTLSAFVSPMMDNITIDFHAFFVPNRLVWEHWKQFMGEEQTPGQFITYNAPGLTLKGSETIRGQFTAGSLYDYMGIPVANNYNSPATGGALPFINALPFRAYNLFGVL